MARPVTAALALALSQFCAIGVVGCGSGLPTTRAPAEAATEPTDPPSGGHKPTTAADFVSRGNESGIKSDWEKAFKDYDEAIRIDPNFAPAFSSRAAARLSLGHLDEAIRDAGEAIRLDPHCAHGYTVRATAWHEKKETDKALKDFDEAIRLDPGDPICFNNRGFVYAANRQLDRAIRDYDKAIRLDPGYSSAFENRGRAYEDKKEYDKSLRDFDEAIRLDPRNAMALRNRASLKATCPDGRYRDGKAAVEDARRAAELTGWKDPYGLSALAAAFAESGDFEEAVKWQVKALEDERYRREVGTGAAKRLSLYRERKPYHLPVKK